MAWAQQMPVAHQEGAQHVVVLVHDVVAVHHVVAQVRAVARGKDDLPDVAPAPCSGHIDSSGCLLHRCCICLLISKVHISRHAQTQRV